MNPLWPVHLSRRRFLGRLGSSAAAIAAGGPLAACRSGHRLTFANWWGYIDQPGEFPTSTLQDFEDETDIKVTYLEEIDDNDQWIAEFAADLAAGRPIGRDLTVLTDFAAARMIRNGWVEPLGQPPAAGTLIDALASPSFDADRRFTMPWQSGLTGIAYDSSVVGELASVNDVFDPAFSGRVYMLPEMHDTLGLVMLGMGIDPSQATLADAQAAAQKIADARASGQIAGFGVGSLSTGDADIAFAWSGDARQLQLQRPEIHFLAPPEGLMLWTDNLLVPRAAKHQDEAAQLVAFVGRPEVAARIAAYVQYLSPVAGTREALRQLAADGHDDLLPLADDPLMFPDDATLARAHMFVILDEATEAAFQQAFADATGL
jgi:spermidine/putrescine transport system substrate-binding protein